MGFRETYLARLKEMMEKYPEAHFEVVTRTAKSVLAPPPALLSDFMNRKAELIAQGVTDVDAHNRAWNDVHYEKRFRAAILANPNAVRRMRELKELGKVKDVFLVCYEKPPKKCHRFILLDMLKEHEDSKTDRYVWAVVVEYRNGLGELHRKVVRLYEYDKGEEADRFAAKEQENLRRLGAAGKVVVEEMKVW